MKYERTIENSRMGRYQSKVCLRRLTRYSLLDDPFATATCFDKALKDVISALPNRPPKESAEEVVGLPLDTLYNRLRHTGLLLRLYRQLW
jgi:hypothetical protein